jgi:hAT family C-terminal dimerisation region
VQFKKVVQPAHTRWNSIAFMIKTLLELKPALEEIRDSSDYNVAEYIPDDHTFEIIKYMLPYMECVTVASEKLSADNCTLPICLPVISELQSQIQSLIQNYNHGLTNLPFEDENAVVEVLESFNESLRARLRKQAGEEIYAIGAVLHPYYKGVPLHGMNLFEETVKKMIENHPTTIDFLAKHTEPTSNSPGDLSPEAISKLSPIELEIYDQEQKRKSRIQRSGLYSDKSPIEIEFNRYMDMPRAAKTEDPLTWWMQTSKALPILARLARDNFAIPVSSAPAERAFSTGGRVVTPFRSTMTSEHISKLIFVQHNMKRIKTNAGLWDYSNRVRYFLKTFQGTVQVNRNKKR